MRVLFLSHRPPYPPDKGDKIRSFHILSHLAARHDVHLACPVDDPADFARAEALRNVARSIRMSRNDGTGRHVRAVTALLSGRPVSVANFHVAALQSQVDALLDVEPIDAVFAYSTAMAEYVFRSRHAGGRLANTLKLLDLIDVDSAKWRDYAAGRRGPLAWVYAREARLLADYEADVARRFDRLFIVTPEERDVFPDPDSRGKIDVLANGVDLDFFQPRPSPLDGPPRVAFTGVMNYWPNVDGVTWFVHEVWPRIRAAFPGAEFDVVGSRPTQAVCALSAQPGVHVHGYVPDVRDYLARAQVCIAPLRIARGVQNKVLEAMSMARPVVATPQALEGIAAQRGIEAVQAADATEFAQCVVRLLGDADRARRIGELGRAFVESHHRWAAQFRRLDELLA